MGFCPKLNLFWHNKHNGLQKFYEYWALIFIFHFLDIFNVFIIGNNFFSFNLFSEDELKQSKIKRVDWWLKLLCLCTSSACKGSLSSPSERNCALAILLNRRQNDKKYNMFFSELLLEYSQVETSFIYAVEFFLSCNWCWHTCLLFLDLKGKSTTISWETDVEHKKIQG